MQLKEKKYRSEINNSYVFYIKRTPELANSGTYKIYAIEPTRAFKKQFLYFALKIKNV
jgi:hypothetical protein